MNLTFEKINQENSSWINLLKEENSINKHIHISKTFIEYILNTEYVSYYFILLDDTLCGAIHFEEYDGFNTLSIEVLGAYQRKGVATKVLTYVNDDYFKLKRQDIHVFIEKNNFASLKLFEKVGYQHQNEEDDLKKYVYEVKTNEELM